MLTFDADKHEYRIDGEIVPSVTHITRFLSVDVMSGADPYMRDMAADRGTRIHEACTSYDFDGENADVDADIDGYVQAYARFKRDYQVGEWEMYERPLGGHGYAGTLDRYGMIDGYRVLLDIKTGSKVNKVAAFAQLAGYDSLLESNTMDSADAYWVLHLKKDGKYTVYKTGKQDMSVPRSAFVYCKMLNSILNGGQDVG